MDAKDLLKKVRKVEIKTKKLSSNLFGGEYHSAFKGRGMTFSEVRGYEFGDDVRTIDWNVTARYNQPFVKVFEEERELTLMLIIDISGSKYFGTDSQIKKEIVTEISATLAFSAILLYVPSSSFDLILEKADNVSFTSSILCEDVGINLNKIKPLGITGYTTIEQNIKYFSLSSLTITNAS